jgi:anthraniloyl-CoA monooxygenase
MGLGGDMGDLKRVAIVGAGPAGLFLARMVGLLLPDAGVEVFERGGPQEVSGFGVTLSVRTLGGIAQADPDTHRRIAAASLELSGIEIVLPETTLRYDGFEVASISRHTLLSILREQAEAVGARVRYHHPVPSDAVPTADVVAFADGAGSAHRAAGAAAFGTTTHVGKARFVWLGTSACFGGRTSFAFARTPYGPMAAHCYPHADSGGTVVVETDEATWRAAGFAGTGSDEVGDDALGLLSEVFAGHLGGRRLVGSRSRWGRFAVVTNRRWSAGNAVLLGDAAHTAHFTVGSGTKLALEDAIALASALRAHRGHADAFHAYEEARRGPVERTQRLAAPSMRWWESYGRRLHLRPEEFGLHFLTRTPAMTHAALRRRCPDRLAEAAAAFRRHAAADGPGLARHAVETPLRLGSTTLPRRLVSLSSGRDAPLPGVHELVREAGTALLRPRNGEGPSFVEVRCPETAEWSELDIALPELDAGCGVVVRAAGPEWERWHETVRYASAVRAETGSPVAVCVPAGWREGPGLDDEADSWSARIQLALLSGRIDLVAVEGR